MAHVSRADVVNEYLLVDCITHSRNGIQVKKDVTSVNKTTRKYN